MSLKGSHAKSRCKHCGTAVASDAMRRHRLGKRCAQLRAERRRATASRLSQYHVETVAQEGADDEDRRADYKAHRFIAPEHDRLNGATLAMPGCGCTVTGRGTIPYPIRIRFCDLHRALTRETEAPDGIPEDVRRAIQREAAPSAPGETCGACGHQAPL